MAAKKKSKQPIVLATPGRQHDFAVAAGADCARCPLVNCRRGPVPPTLPPAGTPIPLLVVGEAPGASEVDDGRTLIGATGREIRRALDGAGFPSNNAAYTNAVLCQPPGNDMEALLRDCRKKGLPSPVECCQPRLKSELARSGYAILMGSRALEGAGVGGKVMRLRGTPVQIPDGPPALPVPHAAFIMRDNGRRFRQIFYQDVCKAIRIGGGGSTWRDPQFAVINDPGALGNFLDAQREHIAIDTETDGIDPWTCGLRRIGFGSGAEVAIYSPKSVRGQLMVTPADHQRVASVINNWAARTGLTLDFHNYYGFDSVVLAQHGVRVPDHKVRDSLVNHSIGFTSELPHTLDFLGSIFTDAPFWKDDVKHTEVKSDAVLDRYLSYDVAITWLAAPWVSFALRQAQQEHIGALDSYLSGVGRDMSAIGIRLDRQVQWRFASEYETKARRLLKEFIDACGRDVNPRSPKQVSAFLYEDLGLPVLTLTDTDEPSTAEPVLLELMAMGLSPRADKIVKALIGYREADKLLGTFIGRLVEDDGMWRLEGGPRVHADGRVRTTWKTGRATGRWSSGDPINLQNQPKKLRAMYRPQPGNVYVAADYSAIELRLLGLLGNDPILIDAFDKFDRGVGPDVHKVNACTAFGCRIEEVTDEVRTFAKRFVYGLGYGAQPPKIHQTLSLLRDDELNPVFPGITLPEVERVYHKWWAQHQAIWNWRKTLVRQWRQFHFLASQWHGRKRYFIGGEDHEEMYNFPIQSSAADIQNDAVRALVEQYPFDFNRRCGLVVQGHDQLVVECPAEDADRVSRVLSQSMVRRIGPMLFPADVQIGTSWKEVS